MNPVKENLIQEILELKRKLRVAFLVHNYQIPAIQDLADFLGDSLEMAKASRDLKVETLVVCGVKFMAETAKILSPDKRVLLPVRDAGCPLADMANFEQLKALKAKHPGAWVVSYVNTSAEVKALSDVCCTSSNAIKVVKNAPAKEIIFVPDRNLGGWVKKNVPEKEIVLWPGFCPVHEQFSSKELAEARKTHPQAKIMVHPECRQEILSGADYVCSTSGMLKIARQSLDREFVIGTEEGMIYRLKQQNPQKAFYSLGPDKICRDMKKITLENLHDSLARTVHNIELDSGVMAKARVALERMVSYI